MVLPIHVRDDNHIKKISEIASKQPYEIWLSNDRTMLDARSLLGLYTLTGKDVNVVVEDYVDYKSFAKVVAKMEAA